MLRIHATLRSLVLPLAAFALVLAESTSAQGPAVAPGTVAAICQVRERPTGFQTTGFIVHSWKCGAGYRSLVFTNAHLIGVRGPHTTHLYNVILHNGQHQQAYRISYYPSKTPDLAAFVFDTSYQQATVVIAERDVSPGAWVQTGGYPYFSQSLQWSSGTVQGGSVYSSDASFMSESGQSGSPVFNGSGQVVGIVWGKSSANGPGPGVFCRVGPIRKFFRHCLKKCLVPGYQPQPYRSPQGGT